MLLDDSLQISSESHARACWIQNIIKLTSQSVLIQLKKLPDHDDDEANNDITSQYDPFCFPMNFSQNIILSEESGSENHLEAGTELSSAAESADRGQSEQLSQRRRALQKLDKQILVKEMQLESLTNVYRQTEHELLELEVERKRCVVATDELVAKRGQLPTLPSEIISQIFSYVAIQDRTPAGTMEKSMIQQLLEDTQLSDDWKRVITANVPILLSDRTYARASGARFKFNPFMPHPEFGTDPYTVSLYEPSRGFLRYATHVAIVLYSSWRTFNEGNFSIPCTQLFLHPRGEKPITVAREALEKLGNFLLSLRVLDVHLMPYTSESADFLEPDEHWSPFAGSSPNDADGFARGKIHTARVPLNFLPALLPAFSNLRCFGLAVPASSVSYAHILSSLRALPLCLEVLVLENGVSKRAMLEKSLPLDESAELTNLKELRLQKFSQPVSYALMSSLHCPSLQSFSVLFNEDYYYQVPERDAEMENEFNIAEDNLPERISTKFPYIKTLDISTFREVSLSFS